MALRDWWDETVVSRVIKMGCSTEEMMEMRAEIIPSAHGNIFELGAMPMWRVSTTSWPTTIM